MGYSTKSIPFFSEDITIQPHTVSIRRVRLSDGVVIGGEQFLDREVSIKEFCNGEPCALEQVVETGDYIVRLKDGSFIQGPEV